jgi:hypothetical protein
VVGDQGGSADIAGRESLARQYSGAVRLVRRKVEQERHRGDEIVAVPRAEHDLPFATTSVSIVPSASLMFGEALRVLISISAMSPGESGSADRADPRVGRVVEAERRAPRFLVMRARLGAAAVIRHEIFAEDDEGARDHRAGERLGNSHHAHVRLDRAIEGKVLREVIYEHERVLDVGLHDRLLRAGLREAQSLVGGRIELSGKYSFREQLTQHAVLQF